MAPSQFKNEQKLSKMMYIIPDFLVLHFGENFMKIWSKVPKLQVHGKLHKNVNENMFSFTFLCNFYEFLWWAIKAALISYMFFNPFKIAVQFKFSQFDGPNAFFPVSTGPWLWFQKGRNIPESRHTTYLEPSIFVLMSIINPFYSGYW